MKSVNFFVRTIVRSLTVQEVQPAHTRCSSSNFLQFHGLYIVILSAIVFISLPLISNAQVLFSEIAWMGTDEDANNEWIELYNFSNTPTDLTGWVLTDDASLTVPLSGTISPHGFVMLERSDDDTLPGTAFLIYTGALSNSGGTLTLRDADNGISDQAVGGDGWTGIGGSNVVPKMTAQRTRTGAWVTGLPTPNAENVEVNAEVVATTTDTTSDTTTIIRRSGGGGSSSSKKVATKEEKVDPVLTLTISAPKVVYVNQEVDFEVLPAGVGKTVINSLSYAWNFGDTNTAVGKKATHTFTYPGEYIVIARGSFAKQNAIARQEIKVLPVSFTLTRTKIGDIVIKNGSSYEVDLGGFTIRGTVPFVFPEFTILKSGGILTIPEKKIGVGAPVVSLYDTQRTLVFSDTSNTAVTPMKLPVLAQQTIQASLDTSEKITSNSVAKNTIQAPQETVIQIGGSEVKEKGVLAQFFNRVRGFFGL